MSNGGDRETKTVTAGIPALSIKVTIKGRNLCKATLTIFNLRAQNSSAAKYMGTEFGKKKKSVPQTFPFLPL